jgi:hypothetical protein
MYVVSCAQKIATLPTPIARASLSSSQAVDSRVGHYLCQSRLHVLGNGIPFVCLPQVMRETTPFQRLLLVQTLRPDRLVTAMQTFATEALGVPTITPNPVSLGTIVEEVRADSCFFSRHTHHHHPTTITTRRTLACPTTTTPAQMNTCMLSLPPPCPTITHTSTSLDDGDRHHRLRQL